MRTLPGPRRARRNAAALAISAAFHVVLILIFAHDFTAAYNLAEPPAPPIEVEIVPPEQIVPPVIPPIVYHTTPPQKPLPPVKPMPELPKPPKPRVAPTPLPPAPTPQVHETLAPPKVIAAPKAPTARLAPAPQVNFKVTPFPQAPAPLAPALPGPLILNLHTPAKEAPAGVASLPMAPPASGAAGGGARPAGAGTSGLSGLPYGAMPSGGSGLRGSLIGCANAEAVGLSAAEKTHCNERFGQDAGAAPTLDPISAAKRAELDKQAAKQERDRKYRDATPVGTTHGNRYGYGEEGPP